jgi:hypothetical protein
MLSSYSLNIPGLRQSPELGAVPRLLLVHYASKVKVQRCVVLFYQPTHKIHDIQALFLPAVTKANFVYITDGPHDIFRMQSPPFIV